MKQVEKGLLAVMSAFLISGLSVLLVPFSLMEGEGVSTWSYVSGAVFWIGAAAGITGYVLIYKKIKIMIADEVPKKRLPQALSFYSSKPASVMDTVLIISAAGTVYCMLKITVNIMVSTGFLFLLVVSVYAHFLLNGKIYQYMCLRREMGRSDGCEESLPEDGKS